MSSKMFRALALGMVSASLLAISADAAPRPGCTLYEHRDFGGAKKRLANGDDLLMINDPDPSVGTSTAIYRIRYDASWNDVVSSFRVDAGCTLSLWEHVNKGGARFRSSRSYNYVGSRWNDQASEALCHCQGLPNW